MTRRHLLLAIGLAGAAWLAIFGDKTPENDLALPTVRAPGPPSPIRSAAPPSPRIAALVPRETLIGGAHRAEQGTALFARHDWTPPPPPPAPIPAAAPTAPPLPFRYFGKQKEGEEWKVFLSMGESTFIVKKNDVIDHRYRVEEIGPASITLRYLPLRQTQTLAIE